MPKKEIVPTVDIDTKVAEVTKGIAVFRRKTTMLTISSEADMEKAADILGEVKTQYNNVEKMRKFFVDPLNKHVKEINARFKKITEPLAEVEATIKKMAGDFRLAQEKIRREAEAKAQAAAQAKIDKQIAAGKEVDLVPLPTIEEAPKSVAGKSGKQLTTTIFWNFQVIDPTLVPRKYLIVDEAAIRKAVQNGEREIKGVNIFEDTQSAVRGA